MWKTGKGTTNGHKYRWEVKAFGKPSEYGIEEGRISILWVAVDGEEVASYSRGWDVEPATDLAKDIVEKLLKEYN